MRDHTQITKLIFVLLSMLIIIGCSKDEGTDNIRPSIIFLQPQNYFVIETDTIINIVLDAFDEDGEIKNVEILVNDSLLKEFDSPPYEFDWNASYVSYGGKRSTLTAIAHDDRGAKGKAELIIEARDPRSRFLGDFYFRTIKETWMLGKPKVFDTTFYNGVIRPFESTDSERDLYLSDDSGDNPNIKITIRFRQGGTMITSLINKDGSLVTKFGYHYSHEGSFAGTDIINFNVTGLGGNGGGYNYYVRGIRQ